MKSFLQYLFYEFLHMWIGFGLRVFFRNVYVYNSKNLKQFTPTIYTGNHENALVDALILITTSHRQPYSMTRSDVFKRPLVRAFLYTIRMLPVYRQRDGIENMRKNGVIFQTVTNKLTEKKAVLIFPEGDQAMVHRLRNLKKGVFRFSFPAEEMTNWETGVHLLPSGMVYEKYYDVHRDFVMHVGEPIYLRDYRELYEKEPEKAIDTIKNDLAEAMRKVMIDVRTREFYDDQILLREMFIPQRLREKGKPADFGSFYMEGQKFNEKWNALLDQSNEKALSLMKKVGEYKENLKKLNIREETVRRAYGTLDVLLVRLMIALSAPFYALSWLFNVIPMKLSEKQSRKLIKDAKFILTLRFGISFLIYNIYLLLLFLLILVLGGGWMLGVTVDIGILIGMALVFEWERQRKRLGAYSRWQKSDAQTRAGMRSLRSEILAETSAIFRN